jgi:hypothetical protein
MDSKANRLMTKRRPGRGARSARQQGEAFGDELGDVIGMAAALVRDLVKWLWQKISRTKNSS